MDLPRRGGPSAQDGSEERAALNVEVLGRDERKVVGRSDRVGGDVRTERGETERESDEERSGSVRPLLDDHRRVPIRLAVDRLTSGRDGDANERERPVHQGDEQHLPPRRRGLLGVSREVGLRSAKPPAQGLRTAYNIDGQGGLA